MTLSSTKNWLRHRYARLMRLDKPIGIWLLMWPCFWSAVLAAKGTLPLKELVLFFIGAVLMRSAGCIINDLTDRDIDRAVERTKTRPLASGEVSVKEAYVIIGILLFLSFLVALMMGWKMVLLGLLWLPLVAAYPWMKRITYWPQAFLGLTFNAGAIFGWMAVRGTIELPAILLYTGAIFWTLGYDTIYAHQDKEDDASIGIGSTALKFGEKTKLYVGIFYGIFFLMLCIVGGMTEMDQWYYLVQLLTAVLLFIQVLTVDLSKPTHCLLMFKLNAWVGFTVFLAALSGT